MQDMKETYLYRDMLAAAKAEAHAAISQAAAAAMAAGDLKQATPAEFVVEIPADAAHGDLAANFAMVNAKTYGMAPRAIAEAVLRHLPQGDTIARAEIAGPGFINLFLAEGYFAGVVLAVDATGPDYGKTQTGRGRRVNVEFVSANPTGPMHLGNARGGALGDVLAEALTWAGYEVTREFYINDAGNQIAKFGLSLSARYLQIVQGEAAVDFPEDGYQGEDIKQRAAEFYELHGDKYADAPAEEREQALVDYALPKNIEGLKADLAKYCIQYDVWFHESALHASGAVDAAVKTLTEKGATYQKDGAVWYKATDFGGEKDEVLVRANGVPTYFAADIAYHADKFARGFDTAIDVWGADHHGHVARMKGALDAMGLRGDKLDIVLMQFVRLVAGGEPVRMSKRTGKAITLTDLLDEVPIDSARFFFNQREPGSQIEFDLDLAVKQDSDNPVYYVQYAHARICSLLAALAAEGQPLNRQLAAANLGLLSSEAERALIRRLAAFPGEVSAAAQNYDPARITRYTVELATGFHKFYTACRIKGEAEGLLQARLLLANCVKITLQNALSMLRVSAPESM